ncbi:uracil phosphoribosyltransferase [Methanococcus voltae]|uniref:Uracil phosphoribosyltransferase n=1 Tax=Methanococcus voltae (strain ATCC BAA-1334 / A3) TaxID=456320 RepID=D7DT67_METV3|nr:uracil phosphoribosyltransferase [Methanococcus voltae]MCS3901817.1 uracil phosphoribosyltransferase [Methanococcus voltae]
MKKDTRWEGVYSFEDSPFLIETLSELREQNTDNIAFRKGLVRLGRYMGYELTKTMDFDELEIETPLETTIGLAGKDRKNILIISVLRVAIPLMEGLIKTLESARVGIVSASRGPAPDFDIKMDYIKVPKLKEEDTLIICDPMIATGSTLISVMKELESCGMPKRIIIVGVIGAPEGIEAIKKEYPNVEIYITQMDRELNKKGYILPGLGDAGDRAFGEPVKVSLLPQMHNLE